MKDCSLIYYEEEKKDVDHKQEATSIFHEYNAMKTNYYSLQLDYNQVC